MNNIEYAWVIQRDDERFIQGLKIKRNGTAKGFYTDFLKDALKEFSKYEAEEVMRVYKIKNCKPVKVKIEVVEDE